MWVVRPRRSRAVLGRCHLASSGVIWVVRAGRSRQRCSVFDSRIRQDVRPMAGRVPCRAERDMRQATAYASCDTGVTSSNTCRPTFYKCTGDRPRERPAAAGRGGVPGNRAGKPTRRKTWRTCCSQCQEHRDSVKYIIHPSNYKLE